MFRKVFRYVNYIKLKEKNEKTNNDNTPFKKISSKLQVVIKELKETFSNCSDFEIRSVIIDDKTEILLAYLDGVSYKEIINQDILEPLMSDSSKEKLHNAIGMQKLIDVLEKQVLHSIKLKSIANFNECISYILSGDTVLFIDGSSKALVAGTEIWKGRAVEEPDTESVVRGPRQGFNENTRISIALLRKIIQNPNLKFDEMTLGEQSKTKISIGYIKGIAHEEVIDTVKRRLKRIKTDSILESGYIEEFIEDGVWSLFPTVGNSERPDKIAAKLLEGKVAILCNGTPFVLTVPYMLIESLQVTEDYYSRSLFSMFIRLIRLGSLFLSTLLPAIYVATISFHTEIIPFKLVISMAAGREGVPLSPFTESLIMLTAFEILREAGVRMPRPVGQTVSIVGALILGEAAVQAGIVSNIMVIVVALTAISSFLIPPLNGAMPILRLLFLVAANILGFMGIEIVGIALLVHLCSLRSFGVPYMSPLSPIEGMDLKDSFIKVPIWLMFTRPKSSAPDGNVKNKYRMNIDFRKKED